MFGGITLVQSEHATAEIDKTPHTDDMREMVEELRRLGQTKRVPAAFRTPQGFVMHPTLFQKLRQYSVVQLPSRSSIMSGNPT